MPNIPYIKDGKVVFKHAVSRMAEVSLNIMERNNLSIDDVNWLVPHQANMRIIDATIDRTGLPREKVMINIEALRKYQCRYYPALFVGVGTQTEKRDNIILVAFGAGFSWGGVYLKWGYDGK
jgi:3-oxoacyl-[acyl-carrier-protein] synthase-3